jgi:hypothetical protein
MAKSEKQKSVFSELNKDNDRESLKREIHYFRTRLAE